MVVSLLSVGGLSSAAEVHYFSVGANDSGGPADTNWNNDGAKGKISIAIGPRAAASGDYSLAVGAYTETKGEQSQAFGVNAKTAGSYSMAIGSNANTDGEKASAFGAGASAKKESALAMGTFASADGKTSTALGASASAKGTQSAAIGSFAVAEERHSSAVGTLAKAQAIGSTAIGVKSTAKQIGSVALGADSLADRDLGVRGVDVSTGKEISEDALLGDKKAEYQKEVEKLEKLYNEEDSLQNDLKASLDNDPVDNDGNKIESDTTKNLRQNLAEKRKETDAQIQVVNGYVKVWQSTEAAVSVGNAEANITRQITGVAAGTEDTDVVNVAQLKAAVKDVNTEAAKHTTVVAGTNITVDEGTNDNGGKAYTVKLNDTLTGLKGVETEKITVSDKVTIDKDGLKTGDVTIKEDGIHAGDKVITGVADGVKATDAVNMRQLGALDNQVKTNTKNISLLNGRVDMLGNRVNRVGAGAAALAGLHPLDYDPENKWDFAAGYGNYKGANALAVGAFYRPDENKMISIGGSFGGGENMVSAGFSVKLGQGTGISTSKAAMANEIRELKEENREMKQEIEDLKQQMKNFMAGK